MRIKFFRPGFTLIEVLLYLALIIILLTAIGGVIVNMIYYKIKINAINEISYNARFVLEKIDDLTSTATGINTPTTGASASSLSLIVAAPNNPTVVDVYNNRLRVQRGASAPIYWTSDEVRVKSLTFTNLTSGTTPVTIKMILELETTSPSNRSEYNANEKYYYSINLRRQ